MTLAATALILWLLTVFIIACYGVHLGIKTQIELKAQKLSTREIQFVPVDSNDAKEEAAINKRLGELEDDELENLSERTLRGGPVI